MSRPEPVLEFLMRLRRLKRAAERGASRVRFALQGRQRMTPLSEEEVGQYHRDGYLLVPSLVPEELVSGAVAAMWQETGAEAGAPETWGVLGPRPEGLRDARFLATYTDRMLAAAAQLAGEDVASFPRPAHVFTINRAPASGGWRQHEPHLDCTIAESRHRTFPRPSRGDVLFHHYLCAHASSANVSGAPRLAINHKW